MGFLLAKQPSFGSFLCCQCLSSGCIPNHSPTYESLVGEAEKQKRSLSLCVFRGTTLKGMLIVDQLPGDPNYSQLQQAERSGWTLTA